MTETTEHLCAIPRCDRPAPTGNLCTPCTSEVEVALRDLAGELRRGEPRHVASGMTGRGARSGTMRRSGHGPGFDTDLIVAVRIVGQRARVWARLITPSNRAPLHRSGDLLADTAEALEWLAGQVERLRQHPRAEVAHFELVGACRALLRRLDPPVPTDARWVGYLRSQAAEGREAWLPISVILARWSLFRRADPSIGPPPSRRTVERWATGTDRRGPLLHAKRPPGLPMLVQVGAVVDLATRGRNLS